MSTWRWRPASRRAPEAGAGKRSEPHAEIGELATDEPLETLEPIAVETGGGMESWRSAKPLESVTTRHLQGALDHEPLLPPGRACSILAAAVETRDLNGPVDIDRLVETVARARPVQQLPRLPLSSPVRGVHSWWIPASGWSHSLGISRSWPASFGGSSAAAEWPNYASVTSQPEEPVAALCGHGQATFLRPRGRPYSS